MTLFCPWTNLWINLWIFSYPWIIFIYDIYRQTLIHVIFCPWIYTYTLESGRGGWAGWVTSICDFARFFFHAAEWVAGWVNGQSARPESQSRLDPRLSPTGKFQSRGSGRLTLALAISIARDPSVATSGACAASDQRPN